MDWFEFVWRASEVSHRGKRKPVPVDKSAPEVIPDAEHELVIERVAAVDVAKAAGKVWVRLPGKAGAGLAGCGTCRAHRSHYRPG